MVGEDEEEGLVVPLLLLLLNEMASTLRGECVIDLAEAYSLSGFA